MMTLACSPVDCQLSDSVSEGTDNTDTTGYSSDEEMDRTMFSLVNPMIVVSNRLPFVLRRDKDGNLERKPRWVLSRASNGGPLLGPSPG